MCAFQGYIGLQLYPLNDRAQCVDGSVQERRNYIANVRISRTNLSIYAPVNLASAGSDHGLSLL